MALNTDVEPGEVIVINDQTSSWHGREATVITTPPESSHIGVRVNGFEDIMDAVGVYVHRDDILKKEA